MHRVSAHFSHREEGGRGHFERITLLSLFFLVCHDNVFFHFRMQDHVTAQIELHEGKQDRNQLELQLQNYRHKKSLDGASKPSWYHKGIAPLSISSAPNFQHPPSPSNLVPFAFIGKLDSSEGPQLKPVETAGKVKWPVNTKNIETLAVGTL